MDIFVLLVCHYKIIAPTNMVQIIYIRGRLQNKYFVQFIFVETRAVFSIRITQNTHRILYNFVSAKF